MFLLLLTVPTLIQVTGIEKIYLDNENRTKNKFPEFNVKKPLLFLRHFKSYYKDNFGSRNTLANNYLDFKNKVLNENPLPLKVIKGKNDFLYLGNGESSVLYESVGFHLFSEKELIQIKNNIIKRKEWLKSKNIKFYVAIAPNKHTIYKENLPFKIPKLENRKTQLINYLKTEINFDIIDLGIQFEAEKKNHQLYRKLDSHWNDLGAFYATQTLLDHIKKDFDIKSLMLENYTIEKNNKSGDISKLINLNKFENSLVLKPKFKDEVEIVKTPFYYKNNAKSEFRRKNKTKKFKVLLFRDSFAKAMAQYINHSFGECTFIWSHEFDRELIKKEKPDLVIMEYVESYIERM